MQTKYGGNDPKAGTGRFPARKAGQGKPFDCGCPFDLAQGRSLRSGQGSGEAAEEPVVKPAGEKPIRLFLNQ